MQSNTSNVAEYLQKLPDERKIPFEKIREVLLNNLPLGYEECMSYGSIGYVVPHNIFPAGYHCDPKLPLPFINIASKKNYIALYHMGIYGNPTLLEWFVNEFSKHSKSKLDMGKSCIRFKKMDDIPYGLIADLARKLTVQEWVNTYESVFRKR